MKSASEQYEAHMNQCKRCSHMDHEICEFSVHHGQIHESWPIDLVDIGEQCEEFQICRKQEIKAIIAGWSFFICSLLLYLFLYFMAMLNNMPILGMFFALMFLSFFGFIAMFGFGIYLKLTASSRNVNIFETE